MFEAAAAPHNDPNGPFVGIWEGPPVVVATVVVGLLEVDAVAVVMVVVGARVVVTGLVEVVEVAVVDLLVAAAVVVGVRVLVTVVATVVVGAIVGDGDGRARSLGTSAALTGVPAGHVALVAAV